MVKRFATVTILASAQMTSAPRKNTHPSYPQGYALGYRDLQTYGLHKMRRAI